MSRTSIPHETTEPPVLIPATLSWDREHLELGAYLDSGADDSFLDVGFVEQTGIPTVPVNPPVLAHAVDGHPLTPITRRTRPLTLSVSGNHVETIQFWVLDAPIAPLVLGRTWLRGFPCVTT